MSFLFFGLRVALVFAIVALQAHLLFTYGIEIGVGWALAYQTCLQILAVAIAPTPLRCVAGCVAAWVSAILGLAVVFSWVTVVMPIAALMGLLLHGDLSGVIWLLGLTAYLVIPAEVAYYGLMLDESDFP